MVEKIEGLNVILEDSAVYCMQIDFDKLLVVNVWFIKAVNHILDPLYLKKDNLINHIL